MTAVVTVTPTIMDGTVIRWHRTVGQADRVEPIVSASRNGVVVHDRMRTVNEWIWAAERAYDRLARDPDADMSDLATHRRDGVLGGPMVAIHRHELARCPECLGTGISDDNIDAIEDICELCSGRGYLRPEHCGTCGEPMGRLRRAWKREGRPDWSDMELSDRYHGTEIASRSGSTPRPHTTPPERRGRGT